MKPNHRPITRSENRRGIFYPIHQQCQIFFNLITLRPYIQRCFHPQFDGIAIELRSRARKFFMYFSSDIHSHTLENTFKKKTTLIIVTPHTALMEGRSRPVQTGHGKLPKGSIQKSAHSLYDCDNKVLSYFSNYIKFISNNQGHINNNEHLKNQFHILPFLILRFFVIVLNCHQCYQLRNRSLFATCFNALMIS